MLNVMNENELMVTNGGAYAVPCYKTINHKRYLIGSRFVPEGSKIKCFIDGIPYEGYPTNNPYM